MTILEMKKQLKSGKYDIRGNEIKVYCNRCNKHFLVNIGTVAEQMIKHGGCTCSPCGTKTLTPVVEA